MMDTTGGAMRIMNMSDYYENATILPYMNISLNL